MMRTWQRLTVAEMLAAADRLALRAAAYLQDTQPEAGHEAQAHNSGNSAGKENHMATTNRQKAKDIGGIGAAISLPNIHAKTTNPEARRELRKFIDLAGVEAGTKLFLAGADYRTECRKRGRMPSAFDGQIRIRQGGLKRR